MGRLVIDKGTVEGKAKIETLKWVEEQLNIVFVYLFKDYVLMKGLRLNFDLPDSGQIKINVIDDTPRTKEDFKKAVEEVWRRFDKTNPTATFQMAEITQEDKLRKGMEVKYGFDKK
jgi:hypothetical protein